MAKKAFEELFVALRRVKNPEKAVGKANYFKNLPGIEFFGITNPGTMDLWKKSDAKDLEWEDRLELSKMLLESPVHEAKYLGICAGKSLAEGYGDSERVEKTFRLLEGVIDDGHARDWATIDMLSSWVGEELAKVQPDRIVNFGAIPSVGAGSKRRLDGADDPAPWEWRRRTACVSLLKLVRKDPSWCERAWIAANNAVRDSRRFSQLGAGWLVREISVHEQEKAIEWICANGKSKILSREGVRYAIEKLPPSIRKSVLQNSRPEK